MKNNLAQDRDNVTGKVLAVDDEYSNRLLLEQVFLDLNVDYDIVSDGAEFIAATESSSDWDAFVIDVMLPDTDGFALCKQLRSSKTYRTTPILLVTGLSSRNDKIKGIQSGANDFVIKPFDLAELTLRLRNNLILGRLQRDLKKSLREVKKLEKLRSDLLAMIVHDLRSPLMGLFSKLEVMELRIDSGAPSAIDKIRGEIKLAKGLVNTVVSMSSTILDLKRLESGSLPMNFKQTTARATLDSAFNSLEGLLNRHEWQVNVDEQLKSLTCDPEIIRRVLVNLFSNAMKYSPRNSTICVEVKLDGSENTLFCVHDDGPGVRPEYQQEIFNRFHRISDSRESESNVARNQRYSTGLGLTFCKLAVDSHHGEIGVKSDGQNGSCFWFSIPSRQQSITEDNL